jgi:glycosyltransferase involved in cell wall biosynthesis
MEEPSVKPRSTPTTDECELSAVMIVYNGIATIGRSLDALRFCDEIVVVDDTSTDGTWEYLQTRKDVRSVQRLHQTMADQRAYATSLAKGRWILTIDSDEYVRPELASSIRREIGKPDAPDGFYLIWRSPYPSGLPGVGWSKHPRLMRAGRSKWVATDHLHSPLDTSGLQMKILRQGFVEHEPLPHLAAILRKYINKSVIMAAQGRARGVRGGVWRLVSSTFARFLKAYFIQGGWRFGASGFTMACAEAFEAFTKYAFLIEAPTAVPEQMLDGGPGSVPPGTL